MNPIRLLKSMWQGPKHVVLQWFNHQQVIYNNPDIFIAFPSIIQFEDIRAINISPGSFIGAFSDIIVTSQSSYSNISGELVIAERVIIGTHANIRAAGGKIIIKRNALIAQNVSLIASNHLISSAKPYRDLPWDNTKIDIILGENVWIGAGVTVLPGCVIGDNSIVGAGSVVTKCIPENEIWAGVPAKKMRNI
jgi:acetyltransferase-like isoleucine patch superfamily enzyme